MKQLLFFLTFFAIFVTSVWAVSSSVTAVTLIKDKDLVDLSHTKHQEDGLVKLLKKANFRIRSFSPNSHLILDDTDLGMKLVFKDRYKSNRELYITITHNGYWYENRFHYNAKLKMFEHNVSLMSLVRNRGEYVVYKSNNSDFFKLLLPKLHGEFKQLNSMFKGMNYDFSSTDSKPLGSGDKIARAEHKMLRKALAGAYRPVYFIPGAQLDIKDNKTGIEFSVWEDDTLEVPVFGLTLSDGNMSYTHFFEILDGDKLKPYSLHVFTIGRVGEKASHEENYMSINVNFFASFANGFFNQYRKFDKKFGKRSYQF